VLFFGKRVLFEESGVEKRSQRGVLRRCALTDVDGRKRHEN
jgi:hypothetical protein